MSRCPTWWACCLCSWQTWSSSRPARWCSCRAPAATCRVANQRWALRSRDQLSTNHSLPVDVGPLLQADAGVLERCQLLDMHSVQYNRRVYKIHHSVNRLQSFLSLGHSITQSLGHLVTRSLCHSVILFQHYYWLTNWLTDKQYKNLQVCFADNNIYCQRLSLKYHRSIPQCPFNQ